MCHFASLAINVCLAMVIFSDMQTGKYSLINIGRWYKATKSGDLYSEPPSVSLNGVYLELVVHSFHLYKEDRESAVVERLKNFG